MNSAAVTPRTPAELREHLIHSRGFIEGRRVGFDEGFNQGRSVREPPGLTHAGAFWLGFVGGLVSGFVLYEAAGLVGDAAALVADVLHL